MLPPQYHTFNEENGGSKPPPYNESYKLNDNLSEKHSFIKIRKIIVDLGETFGYNTLE